MYRICFVTTVSITLRTFVLELAKDLHETGEFELHFACDPDPEFERLLPDYIHFHPISMKRGASFDGPRVIHSLYQLFRRERFDLVQYSTPNASCYASVAARMARVPVRLYCQWGIAYVGFQGVKRTVLKQIERLVCRNSTRIEPDSFGNLRFSGSEGLYAPEKAAVIWNGSASGVNLRKFDFSRKEAWREDLRDRYGIPEDAVVYIFIGRITHDKGIDELLSAARRLFSTRPEARLFLVGELEGREELDADLLCWSEAEPRVCYCGYSRAVEQFLAASDVFVLPSYREGFGSVAIEAEAMGLPAIVTDIPGLSDAVRRDETALFVPKADADALYLAMEQLCADPALRRTLGAVAQTFAASGFEQKELFRRIAADRIALIEEARASKEGGRA